MVQKRSVEKISLTSETRIRLASLGRGNEKFEDVILRLIAEHEARIERLAELASDMMNNEFTPVGEEKAALDEMDRILEARRVSNMIKEES